MRIFTLISVFIFCVAAAFAQSPPPSSAEPALEPDLGEGVPLRTDVMNGAAQLLEDRDPFLKPKWLREAEMEPVTPPPSMIGGVPLDDNVEAIRRWPLSEYTPVAVIWDVQNPKVMILDRAKTMHLLRKNYRIGNKEGIITAINEGEIIVTEKGQNRVLPLKIPN